MWMEYGKFLHDNRAFSLHNTSYRFFASLADWLTSPYFTVAKEMKVTVEGYLTFFFVCSPSISTYFTL